jgi:hypothetical protein
MQKLATLYSDLSLNYMANNNYKQVFFFSPQDYVLNYLCSLYLM